MAEILSVERAGKVIVERIKKKFVRSHNVRYQIQVVNDKINKQYNVFFGVVTYDRDGGRQWSYPIIELKRYPDLAYIENVVMEVKKQLQFTVRMRGFQGEILQSDGRDFPDYL